MIRYLFVFTLYACGSDLCMEDVQGDWVVSSQYVLTDDCNLASQWQPYMNEPYTFRGSADNAVVGPVDCTFDDSSSSRFNCDQPFSMVYARGWVGSVPQLENAVDVETLSCDPFSLGNQLQYDDSGYEAFSNGYTEGLVVSDSEIVVQFNGSVCGRCYFDVQWKLRPLSR